MMLSPSPLAADNFSSFLALADHLGLRLSTTPGHISPPSTVCVALGLEYDTVANTVSLPQAKLCALVDLLQSWLDKPKASERELASVAGKLLRPAVLFLQAGSFLTGFWPLKEGLYASPMLFTWMNPFEMMSSGGTRLSSFEMG